jgi:phosphoribosylaminoimidazole-succinocarboxamide synthase
MTPIRDLLAQLARETAPAQASAAAQAAAVARHAYGGLTPAQITTLAGRDAQTYTGKVRDVVSTGNELLIVHSDRLSAFDRMIGMVPYKGTILTAISDYWLQEAKTVVPTHLIDRPEERVLRTEKADPIKAEVIVRGYLAGSMMRAYAAGEREYCGAKAPDGLQPYGLLPQPIITPTTKAAAFEHDENITPAELIRRGVTTRSEWDEISRMALALFAHGQRRFGALGWLLVDTKYEFGRVRDASGRTTIKVIDEIHTPDSSRFWVAEGYQTRLAAGQAPEMLDKETVRRYLLDQGFSGEGPVPVVPVQQLIALAEVYLKVAETLTGKPVLSAGPEQTVDLLGLLKKK